jgi:7-cyano-7-deazaguanine synthase
VSALPAFVNYGQINCSKELGSLLAACDRYKFPEPVIFDVSGFGAIVRTGLTDRLLRVNEDAFTPNRNMLFLLLASSLAYSRGIRNIVLGLLAERTTIFPDQTDRFLQSVEAAITESLGVQIFTLDEVYAFERHLGDLYPGNQNVKPKIRQQLQYLRDRGFIEFVSRGNYRLRS